MNTQTNRHFLYVLLIALFASCSKSDSNDNGSTSRLSLLQQTWTSRTGRWYNQLTGELIGIVHWNPSVVFRFTSDFKYYASDPQFGTPYTLLPDDSTLIFAYINNPSQPDHYDTNYITSITTNQLTLSSINRITNAIFKDTLRR